MLLHTDANHLAQGFVQPLALEVVKEVVIQQLLATVVLLVPIVEAVVEAMVAEKVLVAQQEHSVVVHVEKLVMLTVMVMHVKHLAAVTVKVVRQLDVELHARNLVVIIADKLVVLLAVVVVIVVVMLGVEIVVLVVPVAVVETVMVVLAVEGLVLLDVWAALVIAREHVPLLVEQMTVKELAAEDVAQHVQKTVEMDVPEDVQHLVVLTALGQRLNKIKGGMCLWQTKQLQSN